jgi:hypothetical protein
MHHICMYANITINLINLYNKYVLIIIIKKEAANVTTGMFW